MPEGSRITAWNTGMEQLAPGVYAYVQAGGTWFINNAGLIVGDDYAIAVDTLTTRDMTESFIAEIAKVTDKPVRFIVNTHFHGDHTYTNHLFPGAMAICDATTRRRIAEMSQADIDMVAALYPQFDFSGSRVTPQDMAFSDGGELLLYQGDREVRLVSVGPAHSPSDVFVHLPRERVVFCGDLLFYRCTPFAMMGYIPGYIEALDRLASLNAASYVPGHGPVCGKEGLYEARDYLVLVRDEARKGFDSGKSWEEVAREIDLGKFWAWADPERVAANVARAYSEFRGEEPAAELDLAGVYAGMMEFAARRKS